MMNTEELESYMTLTEEEFQTAYQNILKIKNMCEDYSLMKPLKIPELKWKAHKTYIVENIYSEIPWLSKFINSDFLTLPFLTYKVIKLKKSKILIISSVVNVS